MLLALFSLGLVTQSLAQAPTVEITGLFKDMAVLRVAGEDTLLRVGESTASGLKLISANTREAVLEYRGQRITSGISRRVGTRFSEVEKTTVSINKDDIGQYRLPGEINGFPVDFLVDTGASIIAISEVQANALNLALDPAGPSGVVVTAQGKASSYDIMLERVRVGGIEIRNVRAAVIEGAYPREILLGMSFLGEVSMREQAGVMTLESKY